MRIINYKNIQFILFALTAVIFSSCEKELICQVGNKSVERREIFLDNINSIELHGSGNLYISYGESQKVEVETNKDLFHVLNTDVSDKKWDAKFDRCVRKFSKFNIYVTLPEIRSLKIDGSGKIKGKNTLVASDLYLGVNGSGEVDAKVDVGNLKSKISGSGDVVLEGNAADHDINIDGSGDVRSYNLYTESTSVDISGSGKALVNVSNFLDVEISGSGDVIYKGSPKVDSDISGSGDVSAY